MLSSGIPAGELASLASCYREKPHNTNRNLRQVQGVLYLKNLPQLKAELVCRIPQQQSQHLPTFAESYTCEFPWQSRRPILATAQDYELTSDHTWKGTSCPLNICLGLPNSSICAYTQPCSHRKTSLAQQYLPWAELEQQQPH